MSIPFSLLIIIRESESSATLCLDMPFLVTAPSCFKGSTSFVYFNQYFLYI